MKRTKTAPYGEWKSPIGAELVAAGSVALVWTALDGADIYWLESRPSEGGRHTIMRCTNAGVVSECTPAEYYVGTTVHEYGGGEKAIIEVKDPTRVESNDVQKKRKAPEMWCRQRRMEYILATVS